MSSCASRISEQKNARGKVPFKNVDEIDREVGRLERQVNGGMMKRWSTRRRLSPRSPASASSARNFLSQFDDSQKSIDELRAKIKEVKDSMDDPEAKAMSEKYVQDPGGAGRRSKAEQDEAYKGISSLRDERTKLQALQSKKLPGHPQDQG